MNFVVEFECGEVVIRTGNTVEDEDVCSPNDLGCPVSKIRELDDVKIKPFVWEKNGCLRCEIEV